MDYLKLIMVTAVVLFAVTISSSLVAGSVVLGDVNSQFGEQRLEEACNELGVEWSYIGVHKIDGEHPDYGILDVPELTRDTDPIAEDNVTIECHLNQGFLASTTEYVTVQVTQK